MKLETTNPRICLFYKENPSLNFDSVNIMFIELFEKILHNMNHTMSVTLQSQILNNVNEIKSSIVCLNETLSNKYNEMTIKLMDTKKMYIDELTMILQNNNVEKIIPLLEKQNTQFVTNTQLILSDIIPKSQNQYYMQIQESIRSFHKSISDDTRVLLKYADNGSSIKEYINHLEMKSSVMIQNLQQPIYSYINSSEERFKEYTQNTQTLQQKWIAEMNELLNNCKSDASPPSIATSNTNPLPSAHNIQSILNKIYNTAEIYDIKYSLFPKHLSSFADSNPNINYYLMKRNGRSKIFIQSTDIPTNISTEDIQTFIQNMHQNNSHGIFLSQNSGIANKTNYQIEINSHMIIVYVHNAEYMSDKIKTAVDIIDHLSVKLTEFKKENETDICISKDVLDEINGEYQTFITQKELMINLLKEQHKRILSQLDEIKIPSLEKYLSTKFMVTSQKPGLKCDICKLFNANNLKALAAHKRGCNRKIQNHANITTSAATSVSASVSTVTA
jgi:hypothetical protein